MLPSEGEFHYELIMESEEHILISELNEKIFQIFSDFMSRVTKFEELVAVGSRLLVGFHQGLEFLCRLPINKTSELIERIFKANETRRVLTYVESGCINAHDSIQNISNSKCLVDELEGLVKEVTVAMQVATESKPHLQGKVTQYEFGPEATMYDKEEIVSSELQKPDVTNYAAMMGIIYSMVKLDYIMQEKIISSLNLKSSSRELESYSLMWSLRPFMNDEIMHQAWRFIS
ncbi:hypothetical protein TEA_016915 [Camellia sinensis var. sinensis]|uniref:DUF7795 domain-containing protein n=1 Tax=Camellia sinensis var. sinensis TaxID=542762 RepID=A0A4S4EES0_CAMSN|nr:hypothetical protein TEA_016915 [Camellia sinensis var. sinensis]